MSQIQISDLPIELQQIIANYKENGQRSPIPKPLTDLREPSDPKKRLHRPNFFFETGPDLKPEHDPASPSFRRVEYPKVKWHQSGTDTTVWNRTQEDALSDEWGDFPTGKIDPADQVMKEMAMLSEEDRAFVLDETRKARLALIREKLSKMSDGELASVTAASGEPSKRGPGRPRKSDGDAHRS